MTEKLTPHTEWDNPDHENMLSIEGIHDIAENCETCVISRLRKDGHPVAVVVGGGMMDGEFYAITNVFRTAYKALLRDDRITVVYDIPEKGSVSVIGHAEIVDDRETVRRFFKHIAPRSTVITQGLITMEKYLELTDSPNRRLIRVIPEKYITTDMRVVTDLKNSDKWRKRKS